MKRFLKPLMISFSILILAVIFCMFLLPKIGLFHYNKIHVISCFKADKESFEIVKEYVTAKNCIIEKVTSSTNGAIPIDTPPPNGAEFYIFTEDREYLYTTGDDKIDTAIIRVLSNLTFETVYYSQSCVVFILSSPLRSSGQGIMYAADGIPPQYVSDIVSAHEIGSGWFYYDEVAPGDYPG